MMLDRLIFLWRMLIRLLRDKCGDMPVPTISKTRSDSEIKVITEPFDYTPTKAQIDALARRCQRQ